MPRFAAYLALVIPVAAALRRRWEPADQPPVSHLQPAAVDETLQMPRICEIQRDCLMGWNAINPSIVTFPDEDMALVAFRGLCMVKPDEHAEWYSNLVFGTTSMSALRESRRDPEWTNLTIVPDPRTFQDPTLKECQMPNLDHAEGPEDPRLIKANGKVYIIVTGYNTISVASPTRPECSGLGFLLHAAEVTSYNPISFGRPVKLAFDGMGMVEKNWAMFHPENSDGQTYAVYSIFPHKIVSVSLDTGNVTFAHETPSPAVGALADQIGAQTSWFHGGAGVAQVNHEGKEYFLSIMHASSPPGEEVPYRNWPYKFSTRPPFEILEVGAMLPLTLGRNPAYGDAVAFVTSVLVDDGHVFIGYGSGDTSSRTFRLSLDEFEKRYFPRNMRRITGAVEIPSHRYNATTTCNTAFDAHCSDSLAVSVCRHPHC